MKRIRRATPPRRPDELPPPPGVVLPSYQIDAARRREWKMTIDTRPRMFTYQLGTISGDDPADLGPWLGPHACVICGRHANLTHASWCEVAKRSTLVEVAEP